MVYMDGVYQHHNTYAVSGTTLTFDTNVPNGAKVEVYHMRSVNVSNMVQSAVAGSLVDVSSATGDVTFNVDLTEASEAAIADGDYILFLDGGATGTHAKEAIADVATLFAGTGLTASSSVINIDAAQTGITSLLATDIKIGEDDQTKIDFETADEIHFYANNVEQVYLADNIFGPQSDSDVDLGATGVRWKDAYIDTVTTTGNAIIGGNGSSGGVTINDGSIQVRTGTGNVAEIRFYCEVSNAHYQTLKAAPHSASSSAALVLPTNSGTLVGTGDSGTVASGMIAADAITGAKIADDAIDSEHYTDGSIDTAHLAVDAVTGAKIADDAIDSEHYTDGSIDTAHIADLQVTTAKIAADAITGAKIADDAIDSEHYTDGSIDTAHIGDDQITAAKVASDLRAVTYIGIDAGDYIQWTADTQTDFYVNGNNEMRLEADGDLHVDGDVIAYSTTIASDEKLKTDINVIDNALDKIKQINGVTFNYKRNEKPSGGVIAQELEKIIPSAVGTQQSLNGSEEYKTVDYNAVIGLLIESVKELSDRLDKCERKKDCKN